MRLRFLPFFILSLIVVLVIKVSEIVPSLNKKKDFYVIEKLSENTPKKTEDDKQISTTRPKEMECPQSKFSNVEIEILTALSKRKDELDKRESEIKTKEALLKTTDLKVADKIKELNVLKEELSLLLQAYNEKEDTKITSLVKIYENMKPQDAAKIFEGLDMHILLDVIGRMKQIKSAPILAQMDPAKATQITMEYANQKKLK